MKNQNFFNIPIRGKRLAKIKAVLSKILKAAMEEIVKDFIKSAWWHLLQMLQSLF